MYNNEDIMSREAGFTKKWLVRESYEIQNDFIIPKGKFKNFTYSPMGHKELPTEIAKLYANISPNNLVSFIEKYGFFGYNNFSRKGDLDGEPIKWLLAHVRCIYLIVELSICINKKDCKTAKELLVGLLTNSVEYPLKEISLEVAFEDKISLHSWFVGDIKIENALELAYKLVIEIINKNILGISRQAYLKVEKNFKRISSRFVFTAMIEVAYWQLLDALEGGEFRNCIKCGKPFIMTDKRQKYCPKLHHESESKCAVLDRQHRRRKKLNSKEV